MLSREEIVDALARLSPVEFDDVINAAFASRQDPTPPPPPPHPSRDEFADWMAKRHLGSDIALDKVVYLPDGAPEDEIRLLEVNRLMRAPEPDEIERLDFTPDIDGIAFKVFVADITHDQWNRIRAGHGTLLPTGWSLTNSIAYGRDRCDALERATGTVPSPSSI